MQPKSFLLSKTLWGVLLAIAPQLIELAASGALGPKVQAAISGLGALLAIYGRVAAKQPISIVPPSAPLLPMLLCYGVAGLYVGGLMGAGAFLALQTGCTSVRQTPIISDILPDLTDPEDLRDAAEFTGVLVLQNNPRHAAAIAAAVDTAQHAMAGEGIITRAMWDKWVGDLLDKTIEDLAIRTLARQRFDRAWERNHNLLDVSGLVLTDPKHRELAEAFVAGLASAVNTFKAAESAAIAAPAS